MEPMGDEQVHALSAFAELQRTGNETLVRAALRQRFTYLTAQQINTAIQHAYSAMDAADLVRQGGADMTLAEATQLLERAPGSRFVKVRVQSNVNVPPEQRQLGLTDYLTVHIPYDQNMTNAQLMQNVNAAVAEAAGHDTVGFVGEVAEPEIIGVF